MTELQLRTAQQMNSETYKPEDEHLPVSKEKMKLVLLNRAYA